MSSGRAMITGPKPGSMTVTRSSSRTMRARSAFTASMRWAVSIMREGSSACMASRTSGAGRA